MQLLKQTAVPISIICFPNYIATNSAGMKKILFPAALLILTNIFFNCSAQTTFDFNHYQTLEAAGKVPHDFQLASEEKFNQDKQQIDETENSYSKKLKKNFYLENSVDITHVLKSGDVLFGDSISAYLSDLLDEVLKNNTDLRDSLQIYYLRSDEVNAFTTPDGIIIVSAGLISQLANEAQLAFILCHEIQHYRLKHGFNKYKRDDALLKGKGEFRGMKFSEAELSHFRYSRELESEADMKGLELYLTTSYSVTEVNDVFDVLLYSYLPFELDSFPRIYFNDGDYKMPDKYFTNKLNEIDAKENDDDEKSTHPNVYKRRTEMVNMVNGKNSAGTSKNILGEERFKLLRNIARFEVLSLQMRDHNYEDAFYTCYLLLKQFPESEYLIESRAAAMYFMAEYKVNGNYYDIHHNDKEAQGSIQQIYFFLNKLPDDELGILATKIIWEAHLKYPSNAALEKMATDMLELLDDDLSFATSDFTTTAIQENKTVVDSTQVAPTDKYSMIKQSKNEVVKPGDEKYYRLAFYHLLTEPSFMAAFNKQLAIEKEIVTAGKKKKDKKGGLDINKLVVADPFYVKLDYTRDEPQRYLAGERLEDKLNSQLEFCADKLGVDLSIVDNDHLKDDDVATFNNMMAMNDWFNEAIDQPDDLNLYNTSEARIKNVAEQFNTDYVSWMGIISARDKGSYNDWYRLCLGVIWFPALPILIYNAVAPNYETDFFILVVNVESGKFEWQHVRKVNQSDSPSVVKGNLYYIIQHIKAKKK